MVARTLLHATLALGLSVGLLAGQAAGAEGMALRKVSAGTAPAVDAELFRRDIDSYVRELKEELRTTLNESLRRDLQAPKIVLAANELRARG